MSGRTRRTANTNQTENTSPPRRRLRTSTSNTAESTIQIHAPDEKPDIKVKEETEKETVIEDPEELPKKEEQKPKEETKEINQNLKQEPNNENDEEEVVSSRTVSVTRVKSGMNVSKFTLEFQNHTKLTAEVKSKLFSSPTIIISTVDRDNQICTMHITKNTKFVSTTAEGKEIANISVIRPNGSSSFPRSWTANLSGTDKNHYLKSKQPIITPEGKFELFFGGKMTVASVKNCILIDQDEMFEVIGIRKITKNILEIDARDDYSDLELFQLGIAAFMAD